MHPAGIYRRFANLFIDNLILLYAICPLVIECIFKIDPIYEDIYKSEKYFSLQIFCYCSFGYYTLMEYFTGYTVGKLLTRTKVAMSDGSTPKILNILLRSILRLIPLEQFTFFGREGFHDSASGTIVIPSSFKYTQPSPDIVVTKKPQKYNSITFKSIFNSMASKFELNKKKISYVFYAILILLITMNPNPKQFKEYLGFSDGILSRKYNFFVCSIYVQRYYDSSSTYFAIAGNFIKVD
ncbi:RDD family protein [Mucilaginibacter gracilis]|uniref:RDD family protein n=1 Tax=Mucilaginibacter gracilis TaxID=423350 RepID=A0A495J785_9SPHI|nr:RDD family protein [Mucilaginibacter gracilis]RKR83879.1 RDD family protein [Mucilaginibacter gracilis]